MATFVAIRNAKQTRGAMAGAMGYVAKDEKTLWKGISLVAGHNCVPQSLPISNSSPRKRDFTKQRGVSLSLRAIFCGGGSAVSADGQLHRVELAEKEFPDFEVLVATHVDTGHLHNHLIVNSVSCVDGKKLHPKFPGLAAPPGRKRPDLHEVPPERATKIPEA